MSLYIKRGNGYSVSSKEALDIHEKLPGGNFIVRMDPNDQLYLEKIENYDINFKLYGNVTKMTHRVLHTFQSRPVNTGILLSGEKGSGKTLLAKNICFEAAKQGVPTILINQPWNGDQFNSLIQGIEQDAIIMFDEFEKVYDEEEQKTILTLLDGVFQTKKLFILTCNNKWRVDDHMRNRPGRLFYMLDFSGLEAEFIREYCQDNLNDKNHIEKIVQISGTFNQFNFDMLKALVEEMNRFSEGPVESLKVINVKAEFGGHMHFTGKLFIDGEQVPEKQVEEDGEVTCNPLQTAFQLNFWMKKRSDWHTATFTNQDLQKIENDGTRYIFENSKGQKVVLTKKAQKTSTDLSRYLDY